MKKPLAFYLLFIASIILLISSCVILGFMIYNIAISSTLDTLVLAIFLPLIAGGGTALLLYSIKILKNIDTVNTLIALYPDFVKTDGLVIHTTGFRRSELIIDGFNKSFILLIRDQIVPMLKFEDIISYNVYENGVNIFEGTRNNLNLERQFGSAGVRGGSFMTDYVRELQIILKVNNPQNPNIVINFLGIKGVDRLSADYREYINEINKLCKKINYMMSKS